jgi:hypothetical protein
MQLFTLSPLATPLDRPRALPLFTGLPRETILKKPGYEGRPEF